MSEAHQSMLAADGALSAVSTAAERTRSALDAKAAAVDAQNAAIRAAHDGGATVAQLVEASGLSRQSVHKILTETADASRQERVRRLLASVQDAAARHRAARDDAVSVAAERRSSIVAAVDAGIRVADVQRAAGLSRARVDAILRDREV